MSNINKYVFEYVCFLMINISSLENTRGRHQKALGRHSNYPDQETEPAR